MTERGKQPGNIGELLTMGMCVLALTVVMLNYLQNVQLLQAKRECRTAGEGLSAENGNGRVPGTGGAGTPHGRTGDGRTDRDRL